MTPHEENWLALSMVDRVGNKTVAVLLERFGDVDSILGASLEEITRGCGIHPELAKRISNARQGQAFWIEKKRIEHHGVSLVPMDSEYYPPRLRSVHLPPPILYCRGAPPFPAGPVLAVVGTRAHTHYGEKVTLSLIEGVARANPEVVILSGMARGIDTLAHRQALQCGLKTIAVLGGGLANPYPPENRELAAEIAAHGAVISEFGMDQRPLARNFPIRNRVIAGMADAVLVVEAGESSGALITSSFAINQGRPVLAVPGNLGQTESQGTNRLIQSGQGILVRGPEDLLGAMHGVRHPAPTQLNWLEPASAGAAEPSARESVHKGEKRSIMEVLRKGAMHPDDLAGESGIPIDKLIGLLLELELSGDIYQTPENQFAIA